MKSIKVEILEIRHEFLPNISLVVSLNTRKRVADKIVNSIDDATIKTCKIFYS